MNNNDKRLAPGAHAFRTAAGATLTYFVVGHGSRLLVNIAPGWGCASVLYQNSFKFLEKHFTIAHLEPRGTRGSSFPSNAANMSSWHMAEDVEALRHHLGLRAFDGLAGHSNGGCIALWYAIRYPKFVNRLVLFDSQALGPDADAVGYPATQAILDSRPEREAVETEKNFDPFKILTDEQFGAHLDKTLALYFARPDLYVDLFKNKIFTNLPESKPLRAQAAVEANYSKQDSQLNKVTAKTVVIVGRQDFACPVPVSQLISQRVRGASLNILENAGHFTWIEQQAQVWSIVKSFYGIY